MQYTKISADIQNQLDIVMRKYPVINDIAERLHAAGARCLLVGGAVRDMFLHIPVKDLDIEVHGIALEKLEEILRAYGVVSTVGKVYGVLRIHGLDVDWSLPRTDASGRKPVVRIDPRMSMKDAFERRDLTMNAMGVDLITHELVDPFDGQDDLKNNVLRVPNPQRFVEDPLRFFRVMQFIARFKMLPDEQLNNLCATMDLSGVSRDRIEQEFAKMLLKSTQPSRALIWLRQIGRLKDVLPQVAALIGVQQRQDYHPEGDVFEHTMQVLDAAAKMHCDLEQEKLILMYAALCHDLGKVNAQQIQPDGTITSHGHEVEGEKLVKELLLHITQNTFLIDAVTKLVRYHLQPLQLVGGGAKLSAYKRLAQKLAPEVTMALLAKLSIADRQGRNPAQGSPLTTEIPEVASFLEHAQRAEVVYKPEEPVLHGRDLLDVMAPGKEMGALLKKAYDIQIEQDIKDKETLKKMILEK